MQFKKNKFIVSFIVVYGTLSFSMLCGRVMRSVVSVRLSVFSTLYLLNQLTSFSLCVGHDRSSLGIESQGHRSRSRVRVSELIELRVEGSKLAMRVLSVNA